jgi:hypothetical protein
MKYVELSDWFIKTNYLESYNEKNYNEIELLAYDETPSKLGKMLPGLFPVKNGLPLNYFAIKVQQSLYQIWSAQKLRSVDLTTRTIHLNCEMSWTQNELYLNTKKLKAILRIWGFENLRIWMRIIIDIMMRMV